MILFMKGEWKLKISLDFKGIHRKPQEMSERVEFHAKLATRGRVYIPKIMVERWMLWKDTPIHEKRVVQASAIIGDQKSRI